MRLADMVSGFVVLLELRPGLPRGVSVENDAVWVLNGKAAITPWIIYERHDVKQTGGGEWLELGINVGDAKFYTSNRR